MIELLAIVCALIVGLVPVLLGVDALNGGALLAALILLAVVARRLRLHHRKD